MLDVAIPHLAAVQAAPPPRAESHVSFHDILSALNPLQYLPVIGTIYRAVTGDQIPEALRRIGSIIVGGLLGGPVGAAISVATIAAEKVTGIDLDKTGQTLLTGHPAASPSIAAATPPPAKTVHPDTRAPLVPLSAEAWSPAQLAAYGVSSGLDGTIKMADLSGADVLNALELSRILPRAQMAQSAYDRATGLAG
jgi:hypothetical protein